MDINMIIEEVYKEVLKRIGKKAILFFTGTPLNIEAVLSDLENLKKYNIYFKSIISDAAKDIIGVERISKISEIIEKNSEILSELRYADFVLVPSLTRNTLSKVALGIQDTQVTLGIAEAFMLNKKIFIVKDGADFENPLRISMGMTHNENYNKMIETYFEKLEDYGAQLINSGELFNTILNFIGAKTTPKKENNFLQSAVHLKHNIITLHDILSIPKGKNIFIKEGAVITPLAADYIRDNNLNVLREE